MSDSRLNFLGRMKNNLVRLFTNRDILIYRGTTAVSQTSKEIFLLGDAATPARLAVADGETVLLSLKTIGRSASNTAVAEVGAYTATRSGSTLTLAAVTAGTIAIPTALAGGTAIVVTIAPPSSGALAWTWVTEVAKVTTLAV